MRAFTIVILPCCLIAASCQREPTPPTSATGTSQNAPTAADYLNRSGEFIKRGDYDKAIDAGDRAVAAGNPFMPGNGKIISMAYTYRGIARFRKGEHDKAMADYNAALETDAKNAVAYFNRGLAWHFTGNYEKSIADFSQALAIDPTNVPSYFNRGDDWWRRGEYGKAIADYTKAQEIVPSDPVVCNRLAWSYATCPNAKYRDGTKAVENAKKVQQSLGVKTYNAYGTFAAACAESGDFAKAREFQTKAIELAPEEHKQECRDRLELYKRGKPYREPPVKK